MISIQLFSGLKLLYILTFQLVVFKKHIGGKAADFRPKAGSCAFSCNHPRPNMADHNCNLGNYPSSKPLPLTSFK